MICRYFYFDYIIRLKLDISSIFILYKSFKILWLEFFSKIEKSNEITLFSYWHVATRNKNRSWSSREILNVFRTQTVHNMLMLLHNYRDKVKKLFST